MKQSLESRFFANVEMIPFHDCWEWVGYCMGTPLRAAIRETGGPMRYAARVSWELFHNREFPKHLFACHTCDNPKCVNPHHVWPGTQSENMKDAGSKKRLRHQSHPKTHRKRGHEYSVANTRIAKTGCRHCRSCLQITQRARRAAKKHV